jgi:transposase-like protein
MSRRGKNLAERARNHYTKEFKFKVAIAAIKGEKQLSELAAEFKVHQTLISSWKRQLMEQGAGIFDNKGQKTEQDPAAVSEELVKTIGHQTIQIDWLKKKLGTSESWRGGQ